MNVCSFIWCFWWVFFSKEINRQRNVKHLLLSRLAVSRFFDIRGNLGNVEEKSARKTCYCPLCVCVCVCVRVCVCVCVFILFHLLASSGCTMSLTYVRSSDQRSFVVSILLASAKFLHLYFWILFHLQKRKLQPPLTGEKTIWYNMLSVEKMMYIDIGNKSTLAMPASYEKILKIRRLL